MHIWLQEETSPPDMEAVEALVGAWTPSIVAELVRLVAAWIPGVVLDMDSPLADFRGGMGEGSDETGVAVASSYVAEPARLTVSETLQGYFESVNFSERPPTESLLAELYPRLPPWLVSEVFRLPSDSVFCLSSVIGPVLLRAPRDELQVVHQSDGAIGLEDDIDIGPLVGTTRGSISKPSPGSREELLAKQLRNYQRRIFMLERELMARSQSEKEKVAFEKSERAKAEARLMEINCQLEERLKARTEDLRKTGQKLVEAQRGMNHTKWLLEDKNKQITKFEYKEESHTKAEEERGEREQQLSKRLLRLAIQEDTLRQREQFRIEKLRAWLKGEEPTDILNEADYQINTKAALERLEEEFEISFKRRQEKFDVALREYDRKLEEKRNQYNALHKDVLKASGRRKADFGHDVGV